MIQRKRERAEKEIVKENAYFTEKGKRVNESVDLINREREVRKRQ